MLPAARTSTIVAGLAGLLGVGLALSPWRSAPPPPQPEPPLPVASTALPASRALATSSALAASAAPSPEPLPPCDARATQPQAAVHDGDVHLCLPGRGWEQLTHHGKARSALLSPSGKLLLIGRSEGTERVDPGDTEIRDHRYSLLDLGARSEREVARNDPRGSGCMNLWGSTLVDDTYALVHADGYGVPNVHNHSMCGIDLAHGRMLMIARRSTCAVPLTKGRFRGKLWVVGFDFVAGQGLSDWHGVVDRQGQRVKRFVDDPFVIDQDGDGLLTGEELAGICSDPPPDHAITEAIEAKL